MKIKIFHIANIFSRLHNRRENGHFHRDGYADALQTGPKGYVTNAGTFFGYFFCRITIDEKDLLEI